MATDDERRRVAEALRGMGAPSWPELSRAVLGRAALRTEVCGRLADLIEPDEGHFAEVDKMVDRDALLALADEMEGGFLLFGSTKSARRVFDFLSDKIGEYARRIREALGVLEDEGEGQPVART